MTKVSFDRASSEYIADTLGIRYVGMQFDHFLYNDDHVTGGSFAVSANDNCLDGVALALERLRESFANANKAV